MLHIPSSRIAACLGLFGLVPFIVLSVCLWLVAPVWQGVFVHALIGWAAVVLAFTGAVHWGAALMQGDGSIHIWRYLYGICPALLGWVVLMCPPDKALFLLFVGFVAALAVDRNVWSPYSWYVNLRAILTAVISLCLFVAYKAL